MFLFVLIVRCFVSFWVFNINSSYTGNCSGTARVFVVFVDYLFPCLCSYVGHHHGNKIGMGL